MLDIQTVTSSISVFKVPYKDIFVGIYVIRTEKGVALFDTAHDYHPVDRISEGSL